MTTDERDDGADDRTPDRDLGMDRDITRRDFLNGVAVGAGGLMAGLWIPGMAAGLVDGPRAGGMPGPQDAPGYYPPSRTGMRGSHPGSFEIAHGLRDGTFWKAAGSPIRTGEHYDLVVVGGGISGLAAAHFYRARNPAARILILDNHDDFGGHAKRNEFRPGGRLLITNGGTWSIDSPFDYSPVAHGLMTELGIDPAALDDTCARPDAYHGLRSGIFFDRETFGVDQLVVGVPSRRDQLANSRAGRDLARHVDAATPWQTFLERTPLSPAARRDIARIQEDDVDYMPGLSSNEKKDKLWRMSYKDYLLHVVKADPGVIPFYQSATHGLYGVGIDAVPAQDCWAIGQPGFRGLHLEQSPTGGRLSFTARGPVTPGKAPYFFHYPDGNASIARLLVRSLVPGAVTGRSAEDIVTAEVHYGRLDQPSNGVRIRLNSTAIRVAHTGGDATSAHGVEVTYGTASGSGSKAYTVSAQGVVLASWNTMIPFICPELPPKQKDALLYGVKVPLVYTAVAIRDRRAFEKLGVSNISSPGSYHSGGGLDLAVDIGGYRHPASPGEPIVVTMLRTPCKPGLSARDQQRVGQLELLQTSFETFERKIRDQLARVLGGGGFDPARDIQAITVNRWPHGYAYEYNPLWDPEWPPGQAPNEIARQRHGRITIACEDAAAASYTDQAMDQAYRAVAELMAN